MKIDFYVLENTNKQKALLFACQLIEKMGTQQNIYIHTQSQEAALSFDTLLWTYREDSFLPHNLYDDVDEFPPPIQIGYRTKIPEHKNVLINLQHEFLNFYDQYNHLIEIVFSDPLVQQSARERYKQYRDQGHELETYKESKSI